VAKLSARGVRVRALSRTPARVAALPGVEAVAADLTAIDPAVFAGAERAVLISSSDPAMQATQTAFVDAAARAGVRHVVKLSGIVAETDSPFRFARMHGEIEKHLERSGMAYTHLRAGEFMPSYFRQVGPIAGKGILPLPMGDARIAMIDVGDVAEAAAQSLAPAHENQVYRLTGGESLTMAEVAARIGDAIGRPVRYVDLAPADARAARLAAGMPVFNADALDELFAERRAGKEATVYPTLRDVFGVTPTTFAEFAKRHAAVFRG